MTAPGLRMGRSLNILDRIFAEAKRSPGTSCSPKAVTPVETAAAEAVRLGIADITLLCGPGSAEELRSRLGRGSGISVAVPAEGPVEEFAQIYENLRRHKGVDREAALKAMRDPFGICGDDGPNRSGRRHDRRGRCNHRRHDTRRP